MNKSRHTITDIEFLGAAIKPRNQIIYLYERFSGVLRYRVRDRLIEIAKSNGCMPTFPEEGKLLAALCLPSLFELFGEPPFIVADLGDISRHPGGKGEIERSLRLIASGECPNRALLMVSNAQRVSAFYSWDDAISASTYIEEALVTPETLPLALSYLSKTSDLGVFIELARQKAFLQKFEEFVRERPRTLAELGHLFDHVALFYFDYDTRSVSAPRAIQQKLASTSKSLSASLVTFVDSRSESTLGRLLNLVDGWRWQKKTEIITIKARFYQATIGILTDRSLARVALSDNSLDRSKLASNFRDRLCWAVLLLSWEPFLVEDNLIAGLEGLCQNFLRCRTGADDGGALSERWGDITLQFATAEDPDSCRLAESRTRLRAVLGERLAVDLASEPTWVRNLGLLWAAAQDEGAPRPQEMELRSEPEP